MHTNDPREEEYMMRQGWHPNCAVITRKDINPGKMDDDMYNNYIIDLHTLTREEFYVRHC